MDRDYEYIRQVLAQNLRKIRVHRNLSQEDLALISDVHRTYVSQIERAVGNPSLLVLCKLAKTLETEPHLLLTKEAE
ncbi:MAG: helix-turn-helix transcriptional regulator [Formivibrio sp.]|nr:helix-turn-helix transcriptional regulator [Formivibrio sp.]